MRVADDGLHIDIIFDDKKYCDLNPVLFGWHDCTPGHAYGPHIRDCYLIHYVISGKGEYTSPRGHYDVSEGQMFLIRPSEVTYYRASDDEPWHYIWIGFNGQLASCFEALPDVCTLTDPTLFMDMLDCERYKSMRSEFLTGQLYLLMAEMLKSDVEETDTGSATMSKYAHRAADYIEKNYMQSISVENISYDMGLSRRYLTTLFKREYGVTTKEYITSVKMRHAKEFLQDGYSVGQTAAMTGYSDYFNFTRMYKKYYGLSPSHEGRANK
ncbi:MAG: AraC family transcriptional regulator [Clostridiales bacterium]|nr:AraC family transcriptional regulator [Clostridiales bacterium]